MLVPGALLVMECGLSESHVAYLGVDVCPSTYELSYPGSIILASSHQKQ